MPKPLGHAARARHVTGRGGPSSPVGARVARTLSPIATGRDLDTDIDRLYGAAPDEFIAARDSLAKELKAAGDKDGAATVKGLRKPTTAAWAVNQLARKHRKALDDLLDLGERLRKAQRAMMSGRAGGTAVKELSAERRKAVNALAGKAVKLLGASGDAQRDAITATLDAAVVDEDAAELVGAGRLTKELPAPSGFGEIPELSVVPDAADAGDGAPETAAEKKRRDERRAARAARRGEGDSSAATTAGDDDGPAREREALEAAVAEKRAALEQAAEEAQSAAREAAATRAEVSRLQDALVSANGRAKAAAERARVAQWAQSQAQQEVDAAERKLYAT
ncbi:MAG TPA: hypothetical protein VF230_10145 [Acidimicrobiales bacterium]